MTLLNRKECSALRGWAIIGIFMHNYLHWLGGMVKENEYQYHQGNVDRLMQLLLNPSWDLPLQLFSFFGHYGVPVFLFLSGYGLVLKYEGKVNAPTPPLVSEGESVTSAGKVKAVVSFVWQHFMKLFPMMLLGFSVFAMVDWITPGHHHWKWQDILMQLTMTINFSPVPDKVIWPGPYWFFGLIMQLYIVYRLLLYRRHWGWTVGSIVVCWAIQQACMNSPEGDAINIIRYNCIGGMLPFGMGLLLARAEGAAGKTGRLMDRLRNGSGGMWGDIFCASVIIVFLLSMSFSSWLWVPAFIVVVNVSFIKRSPQWLVDMLSWMGTISAAIFVCHPITRKIFIPISRHGDTLDGLVLYIVATITLAMVFNMIIQKRKA